jgi:hypothetical protein
LVVVVAVVAAVLVVGAIVAANRGDDDEAGDPGPSSSTTATTAAGDPSSTGDPSETTTAPATDEDAAEAAVRSYFKGVIDKDCPAIVAASTETVWAPATADNPEDAIASCQRAVAAGELDYENYSLDRLEVSGHDGGTISFTAYEMLDGYGYTETIFVSQHDDDWKIDRIL